MPVSPIRFSELLREDIEANPPTYVGQQLSQISHEELPSVIEAEALQTPATEDFERGLRTANMGLQSGSLHRSADIAEDEGDPIRAEQLRQGARSIEANTQYTQQRVPSFSDVQGVGDAVDYLQGGLGTLLPTMGPPLAAGIGGAVAGGLVGGPVGAFLGGAAAASVPAFSMEAGEQASSQQADPYIRENTTAAERLREQNIKGAQNAALESLFPAVFGGRIVGGAARRIAGEALAKSPLRRTLTVAKEGAIESGTEFTQTLTGQASLSRLNPNRDTTHDYIEQIDSIILGALGGTSLSLGTTVPGYAMERLGQRAERKADVALGDLGRAAGELQLRAITEMQQRGEAVGLDVPLKRSMMFDPVDEKDRAEFQELARRYQQATTAGDEKQIQNVVAETERFFFNKHPEWKVIQEGIMSREAINTGGGRDTLTLNQNTGEPVQPDVNMLPDQPVQLRPESTAGAAKFTIQHVRRGEEKRQLLKWRREGFLNNEGVNAAQQTPLGDWLQQRGAAPEEVQAEVDSMIRDIDRRIKDLGDPKADKNIRQKENLEKEKAALETAKEYGDYYKALNKYTTLEFPEHVVAGRFTPQDAAQQQRSSEQVTATTPTRLPNESDYAFKRRVKTETIENRNKLEAEQGIRLTIKTNKNPRLVYKQDVINHALNFFRKELKSFPDGPAREEAALLMGVFADPRVTAILHDGKEIKQEDANLENPAHRAALKLGRPKRGFAFGKKPQDPTTSRAPEDRVDADYDSRRTVVNEVPVNVALRRVAGQLNALQKQKQRLAADDKVPRTLVQRQIRAREFQLARLKKLKDSGQKVVRETIHDADQDITAYASAQGEDAESFDLNAQLQKNIETEKMIAQRRRAEERLAAAYPGSAQAREAKRQVDRLTGLLTRRYDESTGRALVDQTKTPVTKENPVLKAAPKKKATQKLTPRKPKAPPVQGETAPVRESTGTQPQPTANEARTGVVLPKKTQYAAKDQAKSDQATKFIGRGSTSSSTNAYAQAWGDRANSGKYTADDVVFISAEGMRRGRIGFNKAEVNRAIEAGASFVTDDLGNRSRPYNVGEREVAAFLQRAGYQETKPGFWSKTPAKPQLKASKMFSGNPAPSAKELHAAIQTGRRAYRRMQADRQAYKEKQAARLIPKEKWWGKEVAKGLDPKDKVVRAIAKRYGLWNLYNDPAETSPWKTRGRDIARQMVWKRLMTKAELFQILAKYKIPQHALDPNEEGIFNDIHELLDSRSPTGSWTDLAYSIQQTLPTEMEYAAADPEFTALAGGPPSGKKPTAAQRAKGRWKGPPQPLTVQDLIDKAASEAYGDGAEVWMEEQETVSDTWLTGKTAYYLGRLLEEHGLEANFTEILPKLKKNHDSWYAGLKTSKQFKEVADSTVFARQARNLKQKGFRILRDPETGEIMVVDKEGNRVVAEEKELKKSVQMGAEADPVFSTREEAEQWIARAFGPESVNAKHLAWMYGRDMDFNAGDFNPETDFMRLALDSHDPLSFAFHEGMHKFVKKLKETNPELYARIVKAATAPHIVKQMEKLLYDMPAGFRAIDQLRLGLNSEDASIVAESQEEHVAYAFQLYAASRAGNGPTFNIQPSLKQFFQKVIETIARVLGVMTHARATEQIFDALYEGRVQRDGIGSLQKYQERTFKEYSNDVTKAVKSLVPRAVSSPIIQLQQMTNSKGNDIEAFKKLANLWHSEPRKGGETGLLQRDMQLEGQWRNRWHKVLQDHNATKEDMKSALRNLQAWRDPRNAFEKDIQTFFNSMYAYQFLRGANPVKVLRVADEETGKQEWVTPDRVKNYFPRIWNSENILANEIEFREVMKAEGKLSDEQITNFIEMLQATDGTEAGSELQQYRAEFSPYNAAINARVFDFINEENAHKFTKFQEQDMGKIMDRYIRQAVHRREHSRTFGHDGSGIKEIFQQAKKEGATPEQIAYAEKVVKGMEGRLGTDKVSNAAREAMVTSMSLVNFAVLPLALLSSMVDPLGVMVRTGSMKAAGKTFKAGFKQIINDARKTKTSDQELTEYLGIIEEDMMQDIVNNLERGMYMNEKLRRWNKFFFKSIGLEQWTRGTRIGAMRASMEYLKKNADNEKALKELGLEPGMIQEFEDRIAIKPGEFEKGDQTEQARRVQNAVFRMVDEAILRPSAGTRPLWMSDMRFRLFGHLKSYTFTFHNQILRQVFQQVKTADDMGKAALAIMPLLSYVPVMLAADMARDMLKGDDKDRDWDEVLGRAIQRSAILGMGTFLMDIEDDVDWGGLPTNTLLGPVVDTSLNLGRAAVNPDASFLNAGAKLLPYNALWRNWGDE